MRLETQLAQLPRGAAREQIIARIEQLKAAVELNTMLSTTT
ncbi:hypothetical protein [Bradyrhizobium sp. USDA 4454]